MHRTPGLAPRCRWSSKALAANSGNRYPVVLGVQRPGRKTKMSAVPIKVDVERGVLPEEPANPFLGVPRARGGEPWTREIRRSDPTAGWRGSSSATPSCRSVSWAVPGLDPRGRTGPVAGSPGPCRSTAPRSKTSVPARTSTAAAIRSTRASPAPGTTATRPAAWRPSPTAFRTAWSVNDRASILGLNSG